MSSDAVMAAYEAGALDDFVTGKIKSLSAGELEQLRRAQEARGND